MLLEAHLPARLCPHPRLGSDYLLCKKNGVIYYSKASLPSHYEEDYFFKEYKEQYGCSYLEDESSLRCLARRRLGILSSCPPYQRLLQSHPHSHPHSHSNKGKASQAFLLEIGCAFGFFLDEARQAGFSVQGLELSQKASDYAKEHLKLQVHKESFLSYPLEANSCELICAFYVIEHIPQQRSLFKKISASLKKGGLFFFALPSTYGPLFHRQQEKWLQTHPGDHFVDYSPQSLKKILRLYGLSLYKLWPASYHPERFTDFSLWKRKPFPSLYPFFARTLNYGDTIEGIALKK